MTTADEQAALANAYYATFTTAAGADVLTDIKKRGFHGKTILEQPATGLPVDVLTTMRNEGKRVLTLEIMAQVELGKRGLPQTQRTALMGPKEESNG